ncbi:hypothetical protein [Jiangella mangrovi]|uniref:Uncharacterized protein n=1 Tax=Jiangella mangrovi TaxID=1524084 RepID=A0A7W9GR84_9ACTN|nr:hypothetical protein [Jiangella mangrovi]MBB5788281.1 hypothetical protein [Jiangella mangrovi]
MRTRLVRRLAVGAGLLLTALVGIAAPAQAGWEVGSTPDGWEEGGVTW